MFYIVTSEYDGEVRVLQAHCPQHAIDLGRDANMFGTLNAVQVKDQHHLQTILIDTLQRIYDRTPEGYSNIPEQAAFVRTLDPNTTRRFVGNEFNGFHVLDFEVAGYKFTYYPYTGAGGGGRWALRIE